MAQLRHDYETFQALNSDVLVVVPNGPKMIERYVHNSGAPYPILSDKGAKVAEQYGIKTRGIPIVQFTAFKPGVFLIDNTGTIIYADYVGSYIAEPDNGDVLAVLESLAVQKSP